MENLFSTCPETPRTVELNVSYPELNKNIHFTETYVFRVRTIKHDMEYSKVEQVFPGVLF